MKKITTVLASLIAVVGILGFSLMSAPAYAQNVFQGCTGNNTSTVCKSQANKAPSMVKNIINTLLTVLGIISVIMIIIGGVRYTTSGGDASGVKAAKDTVIYSVVGLVVAILSFSIVNFVLDRL